VLIYIQGPAAEKLQTKEPVWRMAATRVICFVEVLLFSSVGCCKLLHGTKAEECLHQCELYSFLKKEVNYSVRYLCFV
jgi:hypothetical protein